MDSTTHVSDVVTHDFPFVDSGSDIVFADRHSEPNGLFESPARRVTANCGVSCAILTNGRVYCWGVGRSLHNGGAGAAERSWPRRIEGFRDIDQFSNSCGVGCGVDLNRDVWCFGSNSVDLQTGSRDPYLTEAHRRLDVTGIAQVAVWDDAFVGRHVDGSLLVRFLEPPGLMRFSLAGALVDVQADLAYCVALSTGRVACNNPTTTSPASPPQSIEGLEDIIAVSVGGTSHYCALKRDGTVWCWGRNEYGQAGVAPESSERCGDRPFEYMGRTAYPYHYCVMHPRQVPGLTDVVEVKVSTVTTCARKGDGTVWCWGINEMGFLGDGLPPTEVCPSYPWDPPNLTPLPVPCRRRPSRVMGLSNVISLAVSDGFACAVQNSGQVWCWGRGDLGSLGNGTTASSSTPVLVPASALRRDE